MLKYMLMVFVFLKYKRLLNSREKKLNCYRLSMFLLVQKSEEKLMLTLIINDFIVL